MIRLTRREQNLLITLAQESPHGEDWIELYPEERGVAKKLEQKGLILIKKGELGVPTDEGFSIIETIVK